MDPLERLAALYQCTQALGVQRDLDALLDQVLGAAQELVGCEHCAVMLLDAERGELELRRLRGYPWREGILGLRLPVGHGISGHAAAQRRAVRVGEVREDPRYVAGLEGARSNLAVPLLVRNELVGVLNVESSRPHAFTEEHEKLCTVLGTQAALAIESSRSRERLEQRLTELDALYRISRLAAEAHGVDQVLSAILEASTPLLPPGPTAILLRAGEAAELVVRAAQGPAAPEVGRVLPAAAGTAGRCARTRQAVLVGEVNDPAGGQAPEVRSEVAAPLLVDGRVAGVLYAGALRPHAFTREHARTLAMLAQQSALVLGAAQMREELQRLAVTDALTGLFNRRHFLAEIEEHLRRTRRYDGRLAVALLDLDGFKALNDRHGHPAGDQALQAVAEAMRDCVRDSDVLARLGGDEFAALLLEADGVEAVTVVERLRRRVECLPQATSGLTLSAGVASFPDHGPDSEALLRHADAALYSAKRLGRNRVELA